jgi:hypothetical protein
MPYKSKETRLAYQKEYKQKNKEKVAEWYQKNKEKTKERSKEYYNNNKEKVAEKKKIYFKTPNGKKAKTISDWRFKGIKCDDFNTLYANYLAETHCDLCRIKFGEWGDGSGTFKCADHDHETGLFRNFLCHNCNCRRG